MVCHEHFQLYDSDVNIFGFLHRYTTVQKTLIKETALFLSEGDDENELSFGLVTTDLTQIKPNYEAMIKGGTLRLNDDGYAQSKQISLTFIAQSSW